MKLLKKYDTDTDFVVCVHESKAGYYYVTTYDHVSREHTDAARFAGYADAVIEARRRAKAYRIS